MYSILFIPLIEPPWNFRVCKYHDYNLYRLNEIRRICHKLRKWPWRYIRGFLTSARDDFYDQTCTEETCVCRCEEGGIIFSCSAKGVKSNIWRNGITRDTKSRNNCKRIPSIRSNMYSDLLNGEHFFFFFSFSAYTILSHRNQLPRKSWFRVKRTIEIPSKSNRIYSLFRLRAIIFLSRKDFLDQRRTTEPLFRLLFCSKKLDAIFESEAIRSILV